MTRFIILLSIVLLPGLASAHEGHDHHLTSWLSATIHSFSAMELALAVLGVCIWAITHRKEGKVKTVGSLAALCLLALGIAV